MEYNDLCYIITSTNEYNDKIYYYMGKKRKGWTTSKYKAYHFKTKETAFDFGKRYFKNFKDWAVTTYKADIESSYNKFNNSFYSQYNDLYNI